MDRFSIRLTVTDTKFTLVLASSIHGVRSRPITRTFCSRACRRQQCKFPHPSTIVPSWPNHYTRSAWIGSVQSSLVFLPGLVFGRLFDIGYFRIPFLIASSVLIMCTFLVAECTQYWHFMLCQGFTIGVCSLFQVHVNNQCLTLPTLCSCVLVSSLVLRWPSSDTGLRGDVPLLWV